MAVTINGSGPIAGATTVNGLTLPTDSLQPGMVLVNTTTFNAASSVSINNVFTSTYANYKIVLSCAGSYTSINNIFLKMRVSGTDEAGGSSYYSTILINTISSGPTRANAATSYGYVGYIGNYNSSIVMEVGAPAIATMTSLICMSNEQSSADAGVSICGVTHIPLTAYDGFTFYPSSGNITGTIRVYGYRNS